MAGKRPRQGPGFLPESPSGVRSSKSGRKLASGDGGNPVAGCPPTLPQREPEDMRRGDGIFQGVMMPEADVEMAGQIAQ